jgi:acetyl-CoA carboxylase biotin carboxylase subunit
MKVLIANRGEIAIRILRACHELDLEAAVIYSEADRLSPHVLKAWEAHCIGPAPAGESYLRGDKIVDLAKRIGAGAIHPGYGFLAENAGFARLCRDAKIIFIGPNPESMELLGSKTLSRREARKNNIPITPGTVEPITDLDEARKVITEIGFPVLLKAAAGGGGKGMRVVERMEDLPALFERATDEAQAYFSDPAVYIEKVILAPRHIEIQLMADRHGNAVHLGERECSMQRRHQKIFEETPSPVISAADRAFLGETAVRVAKMAGYDSAGTAEFLRDKDGKFYFLEMNTRIQVEHPTTEMTTGVDLVKEQIRIALGDKLSLKQEEIRPRGHAMECRIYAEDPLANFAPSPGRILHLQRPDGPGIRVDSGVEAGSVVPLDYDPLLAKLVVWGETREEARLRTLRALYEYRLDGIATTIPFFKVLLEKPEFRAGDYDTTFVDTLLQTFKPAEMEDHRLLALAMAAKLFLDDHETKLLPPQPCSPWRML